MPENDTPNASAVQHHGRKRPSQSRVVPAIPLAFSRPRQTKSQPKVNAEARAGTTPTTPAAKTPEETFPSSVDSHAENGQPQNGANGHHAVDIGLKAVHDSETLLQNGSNASAAGTPASRDSAPMSISNGATPEPATADHHPPVLTPPCPTTGSSQGRLVSPSSARKSTDRFDVRPIRTELPPEFVPSAERFTPQSATASANPHRAQHASTSSIMFGALESATSSPAPPQCADSNLNPVHWPPLGANPPPQSKPSGHAHHASEPYAQRGSYYQQNASWQPRHPFQPPMHIPHQHQGAFRYPPREAFTPVDECLPDGEHSRSRSLSQNSYGAPRATEGLLSPLAVDGDWSKSGARESRMHFHPVPPNLRHPFQHHAPPQMQQGPPEMALRFENAEALRHHVQSQLGSPLLADCHLQILEDETGGRQYLDAHKIILARSSRLLNVIQRSDPPASATLKTQVHIPLQGRYIRIKMFMDCVQYLYGGALASLDQLRHATSVPDAPTSNEERMHTALQYVATSTWLALPAIAVRAMGVALSLLHWDTMSAVLGFALDGGLGPSFVIDDGSEITSCSSSDDSLGRADGNGMPTYDPYSTDLLHRIIDFSVHMFPSNFYLDASAPQLTSCARLPPMPPSHESRPSRSDPRLSQIRFGELSVEDHNRPSQVTTTISSMLLSLPFALLKCILEHNGLVFQLGADTVASIMRQVVAEREMRRKRVLQARTAAQADDATDLLLVHNLYSEESVEPSPHHRAGFRLARRKRGIDTPPSSGAVSERSK